MPAVRPPKQVADKVKYGQWAPIPEWARKLKNGDHFLGRYKDDPAPYLAQVTLAHKARRERKKGVVYEFTNAVEDDLNAV